MMEPVVVSDSILLPPKRSPPHLYQSADSQNRNNTPRKIHVHVNQCMAISPHCNRSIGERARLRWLTSAAPKEVAARIEQLKHLERQRPKSRGHISVSPSYLQIRKTHQSTKQYVSSNKNNQFLCTSKQAVGARRIKMDGKLGLKTIAALQKWLRTEEKNALEHQEQIQLHNTTP